MNQFENAIKLLKNFLNQQGDQLKRDADYKAFEDSLAFLEPIDLEDDPEDKPEDDSC